MVLFVVAAAAGPVLAQSPSSSSTPSPEQAQENPVARPRAAQVEAGGAAVTLETSEPLFEMAAALNACGYDADLDTSMPVRAEVRADMNEALAASESARASRDALCAYVRLHRLNDMGMDVGQYVSLSLYLSPPPELTPNVDETELPPQAAQVVNVLPLLRAFSSAIDLHYLWLKHRPEYEVVAARVHDPMTQMILATNIYLHQPVSSYDGRRFLVLLEPMLSPALTNARIYGSDSIIVTSPSNVAAPAVPVRLDQIRHIYLHYVVEPLVYSRGSAMERIQPLLASVADAPLEFTYKSDVVALITECLIKAIEDHMYVIAGPGPVRPRGAHSREAEEQYTAEKTAYDRETDLERGRLVNLEESQGWVLVQYFYDQLTLMGHNGDGLRDEIAPMIYGMDVERAEHHAREILFSKDSTSAASADPLRPTPRVRTMSNMDRAELALLKGDGDEAAELADKEMAEPKGDHGRALYVLARVDLMHGDPQKAMDGFALTLQQTTDPRTLAWSHIYLGRLYDVMQPPSREKAVAEYRAALATRDSLPDTKKAAQDGLAKPFALPRREVVKPEDGAFDPTGKAEKDAYKPGEK
jgi:hypothetical protein